jgi:hypothetical protein
MTDAEILTLATRHNIVDKFDVRPRAEEVVAFARDLAGAVMAEVGKAPEPSALDWRAAPRVAAAPPALEPPTAAPPPGASPMSDSDMVPL